MEKIPQLHNTQDYTRVSAAVNTRAKLKNNKHAESPKMATVYNVCIASSRAEEARGQIF